MKRSLWLLLLCAMMTGCGIKGALVRPSDIPAQQQQQEKSRGSLPL